MEHARPFSKIVLALHMTEAEGLSFIRTLGLHPDRVPRHETSWGHVAASDADLVLTFGRKGLKRVNAHPLVDQLVTAGYRYHGCIIALKPDTYTKTEARAALRAHKTHIKEGARKLDGRHRQIWKFCLEISFDFAPARALTLREVSLVTMLQPLVWRRGRVFCLRDEAGRSSVIELVQPKKTRPPYVTELHFRRDAFFQRSVSLP